MVAKVISIAAGILLCQVLLAGCGGERKDSERFAPVRQVVPGKKHNDTGSVVQPAGGVEGEKRQDDADAGQASGTPGTGEMLHAAVEAGEIERVSELLAGGVDVDARDGDGKTALLEAVWRNNTEMAKLLLGAGAEQKRAVDSYGRTPLHWAAWHGNIKVARLITGKGARIDAPDHGGDTPLHSAALNYNLRVAEFLISRGADVNARGLDGQTPLYRVFAGGVGRGSSIDFEAAARMGKLLLANGADISKRDDNGMTPLHGASEIYYIEGAAFLISNGADVNAVDDKRRTPMDVALESYNMRMVSLLHNSDGRASEAPSGNLADIARRGEFEKVRQLAAAGGEVNIGGTDYYKALHYAAGYGDANLVQYLLDNGADINAKGDHHSYKALHVAARGGHLDVVRVLIQNGADVNAKERVYTPLQMASEAGEVAMVKFLLEEGADVASRSIHGQTALHIAASYSAWGKPPPGLWKRRAGITKLLLSKGADVNAMDGGERTPLDRAYGKEMKELLRSHGAKTGKELQEEDK